MRQQIVNVVLRIYLIDKSAKSLFAGTISSFFIFYRYTQNFSVFVDQLCFKMIDILETISRKMNVNNKKIWQKKHSIVSNYSH